MCMEEHQLLNKLIPEGRMTFHFLIQSSVDMSSLSPANLLWICPPSHLPIFCGYALPLTCQSCGYALPHTCPPSHLPIFCGYALPLTCQSSVDMPSLSPANLVDMPSLTPVLPHTCPSSVDMPYLTPAHLLWICPPFHLPIFCEYALPLTCQSSVDMPSLSHLPNSIR